MKTLTSLKEGEKAHVCELLNTGGIRRRLMDMGLVEGTEVTCALKSPCGDPVAYLIKGTLIAIRSEDTDKIMIT